MTRVFLPLLAARNRFCGSVCRGTCRPARGVPRQPALSAMAGKQPVERGPADRLAQHCADHTGKSQIGRVHRRSAQSRQRARLVAGHRLVLYPQRERQEERGDLCRRRRRSRCAEEKPSPDLSSKRTANRSIPVPVCMSTPRKSRAPSTMPSAGKRGFTVRRNSCSPLAAPVTVNRAGQGSSHPNQRPQTCRRLRQRTAADRSAPRPRRRSRGSIRRGAGRGHPSDLSGSLARLARRTAGQIQPLAPQRLPPDGALRPGLDRARHEGKRGC